MTVGVHEWDTNAPRQPPQLAKPDNNFFRQHPEFPDVPKQFEQLQLSGNLVDRHPGSQTTPQAGSSDTHAARAPPGQPDNPASRFFRHPRSQTTPQAGSSDTHAARAPPTQPERHPRSQSATHAARAPPTQPERHPRSQSATNPTNRHQPHQPTPPNSPNPPTTSSDNTQNSPTFQNSLSNNYSLLRLPVCLLPAPRCSPFTNSPFTNGFSSPTGLHHVLRHETAALPPPKCEANRLKSDLVHSPRDASPPPCEAKYCATASLHTRSVLAQL